MYVARNENGSLFAHQNKPVRGKYYWVDEDFCFIRLDCNLSQFSNLEWEHEPVKVTIWPEDQVLSPEEINDQ
jgi:hypothetical protein